MNALVTLEAPSSSAAEAYRALRTNLMFARPGEPLRAILVAAPSPDEERSVTAANLAVVSAQGGRRVALVDCDLRRPSQHRLFGLANEAGVTTALVSGDGAEAVPWQQTAVEGLRVLSSGPVPPNPAELLASPRMADLVRAAREGSDLAIFDAPPLLPVTDAALLAPRLDGVILVLAAGRSRREHASRARAILDNVGARLLGVVLTDVDEEAAEYGTYGPEGA